MPNNTPLSEWLFLVGKWKGSSIDHSREKVETVSTVSFSTELGSKYIMGKHDFYKEGKLDRAVISVMFFDSRNERFIRKTFSSLGYVHNEVEHNRTNNEIYFDVKPEPIPQHFEELRLRSYIRKASDVEISLGLLAATEGEDFEVYYETILAKQT